MAETVLAGSGAVHFTAAELNANPDEDTTQTTQEAEAGTSQTESAADTSTSAAADPEAPTGEGTEPASPQSDALALLDTLDADTLRRHPRFAGILGNELQRERANLDAQRKLTEDRELLERDPFEFRTKIQTETAQVEQAKAEATRVWQTVDKEFLPAFHFQLPEAVRKTVDARTYDTGKPDTDRLAYLTDVAKEWANHIVTESRSTWEKDAIPALRAQVLAELNGSQPAPKVVNGTPVTKPTPKTNVETMGLDEYLANRDELLALIPGRS